MGWFEEEIDDASYEKLIIMTENGIAIAADDRLEKILENPQMIETPVVRNGKQSILGYMPEVCKGWD